jgi:hypothetical protein
VSPERRVAADAEGWSPLAAEAYLGLGRPERALETCREAVALIRERELAMESVATITLARVLLGTAGLRARDEIEAVLARAEEVVRTLGTVVVEPLIHEVHAELAQQAGDVRGHAHHVREAHRLFVQMGATGHVERLERKLAAFAT